MILTPPHFKPSSLFLTLLMCTVTKGHGRTLLLRLSHTVFGTFEGTFPLLGGSLTKLDIKRCGPIVKVRPPTLITSKIWRQKTNKQKDQVKPSVQGIRVRGISVFSCNISYNWRRNPTRNELVLRVLIWLCRVLHCWIVLRESYHPYAVHQAYVTKYIWSSVLSLWREVRHLFLGFESLEATGLVPTQWQVRVFVRTPSTTHTNKIIQCNRNLHPPW